MADSGLAQAKAKLDGAVAEQEEAAKAGDWGVTQLVEQKLSDALYIAQEALVAFRREGNNDKKVEALEVVVQAKLALGDSLSALVAAQDELAMIRRGGDKKHIARVLDMLSVVQTTHGNGLQALESVTELVDLQKELGDKDGEAKALRNIGHLQVLLGRPKLAMEPAQKSLKLYQELGSKEGEEMALRTISEIHTQQGMPQKAPNRKEALAALQDLQVAIEQKDAAGWNATMEVLNKTCAYTQKDVDDVVQKAVEADESGARSFLSEQGVGSSKKNEAAGEQLCHEVIKRMTYIQFRIGGLGYGPRFRCLQAHGSKVKGLNEPETLRSMKALAVLQVSDEAEDWEKELGYQPGILDGMLQSLTALG